MTLKRALFQRNGHSESRRFSSRRIPTELVSFFPLFFWMTFRVCNYRFSIPPSVSFSRELRSENRAFSPKCGRSSSVKSARSERFPSTETEDSSRSFPFRVPVAGVCAACPRTVVATASVRRTENRTFRRFSFASLSLLYDAHMHDRREKLSGISIPSINPTKMRTMLGTFIVLLNMIVNANPFVCFSMSLIASAMRASRSRTRCHHRLASLSTAETRER